MSKSIDLSVIHSTSFIKFPAVAPFSESTRVNQNIRKSSMYKLSWMSKVTSIYTVVSNVLIDYYNGLMILGLIKRHISKSQSI